MVNDRLANDRTPFGGGGGGDGGVIVVVAAGFRETRRRSFGLRPTEIQAGNTRAAARETTKHDKSIASAQTS